MRHLVPLYHSQLKPLYHVNGFFMKRMSLENFQDSQFNEEDKAISSGTTLKHSEYTNMSTLLFLFCSKSSISNITAHK